MQDNQSKENAPPEAFKPFNFNFLLSKHCKSLLQMQFPQNHPLRPYSLLTDKT
jgi:hypothetical protein